MIPHSTGKTGAATEIELSGFEKGNEYVITNRITTAPDGLVFERSIRRAANGVLGEVEKSTVWDSNPHAGIVRH